MLSAVPDLWSGFLLGAALEMGRAGSRLTIWRSFVTWGAAASLVTGVMTGRLDEAGICAAVLAVLGRDWWKRKGRKAAGELGAKSRALVENLVERVREAGTPVPQGASG